MAFEPATIPPGSPSPGACPAPSSATSPRTRNADRETRTSRRPALPSPTPPPRTVAQSVAFSPDGARLACGSASGVVAVFDVGSGGSPRARGPRHAGSNRRLLARRETLYTGCGDGHVHAYDAEHKPHGGVPGHKAWVMGVDASPDGRARELRIGRRGEAVGSRAEDVRAGDESDQTAGLWGVRFGRGGRVAAVGEDERLAPYAA